MVLVVDVDDLLAVIWSNVFVADLVVDEEIVERCFLDCVVACV